MEIPSYFVGNSIFAQALHDVHVLEFHHVLMEIPSALSVNCREPCTTILGHKKSKRICKNQQNLEERCPKLVIPAHRSIFTLHSHHMFSGDNLAAACAVCQIQDHCQELLV